VRILKSMRQEQSGLARTTLEHAKFEARLGHDVAIREPQGQLLWGQDFEPDIITIHSQLSPGFYHDGKPKIMLMHGEPLSSVGNGISFKAILDLAPMMDCFICMRRAEWPVWSLVKRTHYVPKGIDLEIFHPIEGVQRLEGEPAVLCYENIRGIRNPLYVITAMAHVVKKLPKARLHIFNVTDKKMYDTFSTFVKQSKLWTYVRTLTGPVKQQDVPGLLNRADIVVSSLYPLSARGIEALGCGKAYVSAGYDGGEGQYPWIVPEYSVEAFADTIIDCWGDYQKINYREYGEKYHDEAESSKQRIQIYEKYV
jgi:glycosyltransferase involved in cell wall biosynthesis